MLLMELQGFGFLAPNPASAILASWAPRELVGCNQYHKMPTADRQASSNLRPSGYPKMTSFTVRGCGKGVAAHTCQHRQVLGNPEVAGSSPAPATHKKTATQ